MPALAHRSPEAVRQARHRQRQRDGRAIFHVEADHDALVLALLESGRLRCDPRGHDGGVREELAAGMKKKKERRVYLPRVLGSGQVMMPADLKRLHKYMLEIEHISVISDEVRRVVEEEWPELAHKLPPKS
jgi:hypothetical protein